jgi:hypothetical protein
MGAESMIASDDLHTLQLAPLWVLSALSGTHAGFERHELDAFWDTVVAVCLRTPGTAQQVLQTLTEDRSGLVLDYELDDRSVVTGLTHVVAARDRLDPATAYDFKIALLRIGVGMGRARGPYGRSVSSRDEQTLLLVAELLEIRRTPSVGDNVFV